MDFEVVYTEAAVTDLEAILNWSLEEHPERTDQFLNSLTRHIGMLRTFPWMGTRVKRFARVRRIQHAPFVVYYRVTPEHNIVEVLHIWHGKRKPPSIEC